MAAKVGFASAVSYGIGVQNRYSAFLDDEDAINSPITDHVSKQIASKQQQSHKGSSTVSFHHTGKPGANNQSSNSVKSSSAAINRNASANNKQHQSDHQQAKSNELNQQKRQVDSGKRQPRSNGQPQNGVHHAQGTKQYQHGNASKPANHSQESAANNKFPRNHQQPSNQSQSGLNKEDNEGGYNSQQNPHRESKFTRGAQQNQRRQFHNADEKKGLNNISNDDATNAGPSSNEDHKRRRQQKRAIDMKYKDPEKREARRQQVTDQQTNNHKESVQNSKVDNAIVKGFRNRRDTDQGEGNTKVNADDTNNNRGFRGRRGPRAKPGEHGDANNANGEQKSSGQESGSSRGARNRPPRKNGFGPGSAAGPRTGRGPRTEDKPGSSNIEISKPIPNFSDKLDFPSLAS